MGSAPGSHTTTTRNGMMTNVISTGQPSTLGTYKQLAVIFGPKAVAFIEKQIKESPHGEDEEVIADERQVLMLLASMMEKP